MAKLWACCLLGVVALVLHELRPYKVRARAHGFTSLMQAAAMPAVAFHCHQAWPWNTAGRDGQAPRVWRPASARRSLTPRNTPVRSSPIPYSRLGDVGAIASHGQICAVSLI